MIRDLVERLRELRSLIASEKTSDRDRIAANRELADLIEKLCPSRRLECRDPLDGQPWYVTVSGTVKDNGSVTWQWNATRIHYEDHEWQWDFPSAEEAATAAMNWFRVEDLGTIDLGSTVPEIPRYPGWSRVFIATPSRKHPHGRTVVGRTWHVARAIRDWMAAHGIRRPATPPKPEMQPWGREPQQERIYSLTPLDIGFDPRALDEAIVLPTELDGLRLECHGRTYTVRGTREELIAAARAAGYRIAED